MSEKTDMLADVIGYERYCDLCHVFGGEYVYVPHKPQPCVRNRRLRQEFDHLMYGRDGRVGRLIKILAKKYDISERQVRRICFFKKK